MQGVSTVLLPGKNKSRSTEKNHYSYQLKYQNSSIWNHKSYCDWISYTNSISLACKKRDWNNFKWLNLFRKLNSILLLFTQRTHVIAGPALGWFRGNGRSCLWHCAMLENTSHYTLLSLFTRSQRHQPFLKAHHLKPQNKDRNHLLWPTTQKFFLYKISLSWLSQPKCLREKKLQTTLFQVGQNF